MSEHSDPRVDLIFSMLAELAAGNLAVQVEHSGAGDEMDAIIEGVNMLAEELRGAKAELQQATERLVRNEKLTVLGQLCGGVAHELRNPMGAIKNGVFFLKMALERPEPEVVETLQIIESEVSASEKLVGNLLDFSRVKPGNRIPVEVNALLAECLVSVPLADDIAVERELAEDLPTILGDPDQLKQVFRNLILNGVQAMALKAEGKRLGLQTARVGEGKVAVTVIDNGLGIAADDLSRIFEPLYTTKAKGIGLGLAVVRAAVERHQGTITVKSTPGQGTTLRVLLPLGRGEEGSA